MLGSLQESIRWCWQCFGGAFRKDEEKACKVAKNALIVGNDLALRSFNGLQADLKEAL